jgi:hypothetical protein
MVRKKKGIIGLESGIHNKDLQVSSTKLLRSGSYKKQRVISLIPAIEPIPPKVYLSHCALIFPPNQGVFRFLAEGDEVGIAFNNAVETILKHPDLSKWEYLLTIEADNIPQPDALIRLLQRMEDNPQLDAIGGLYWTKGLGGVPQIWGDPKDTLPNYRPQLPDVNGGLVECCGLGMGFTLYRLKMLKDPEFPRPFFKTLAGKEGVGTQDLYFWGNARRLGYRCAVDCGTVIGHYDFEGKYGEPDTTY